MDLKTANFNNKPTFSTIIRFFFIFAAFMLELTGHAQFYLSGQDPSSLRWKQIQTSHFRLIFPLQYHQKAHRLAGLLEHTYPKVRTDLNSNSKKSDVILHTQSVISNATAAWAPRRLDLYHTPPQDGYAQEWFKQLSIHELRHIAQFSRLEVGLGKIISTLLGQQGTAALMGTFVPMWFIEGDAVVSETAFSNSGRGRQPLFEAKLRAQLIEKGIYSYEKANFGSYKHFTPNVYEFGYFMVGFNKVKYGAQIWENALNHTARKPYLIQPFNISLKQSAGMKLNSMYIETMIALKNKWINQDNQTELSPFKAIIEQKPHYTNYHFPQILSNGSIVATRTSVDDIPRIVSISKGHEKVLFTPGSIFNQSLSSTDSLVVWNEYQGDIRWSNRNYSVIKIGNILNGKVRQHTRKSRLFSPDLSRDNRKIVAAETDESGRHALVVLSCETAEELFRMSNDSVFFQTPKWAEDNIHIIVAGITENGKSLMKVNSITANIEQLMPNTFTDFHLLSVEGERVLLNGAWTGIQNIFLLDVQTKAITQLTSSRFGAKDAAYHPKTDRLIYTDYTSDGFQIVEANTSSAINSPLDNTENCSNHLAEELAQMQSFNIDTVKIADSIYPVSNYIKRANLFHIHSWTPFYFDVENIKSNPGISIFSQNTLSTMVAEVGFQYDLNEQTGRSAVNINYLGFFPVLKAGFSSGLRRGQQMHQGKLYNLKWWENDVSFGFRLPLNLTKDKWLRGIQPSISLRQLYRKMDPTVGLDFKQNFTTALTYDISAWNQSRRSVKDLYPAFGQSLRFVYRHSPFDMVPSQQLFVSTNLFFPGFYAHHGLRLYGAIQNGRQGFYKFSNLASTPRGSDGLFYDDAVAFKADYVLPIWYPEWSCPTLFYLKRVKGGVFTDYFAGKSNAGSATVLSSGIELFSEWHFLNFPAPIDIGARFTRQWNIRDYTYELLFSINFNELY